MHLTVRAGAVIFLLSVAAIAGSKTGIVWDAGGVTGRDVYSARGNGKKVRNRTARSDEDATLLTISPNGKRMAWWLIPPGVSGDRDLVVARTAGGRGRNVTERLDGTVTTAKFTGDSKHLLFVHEDPTLDRTDLWRTNVRGKGRRNLTREVPGKATGTLWVSPFGAEVLVEWEFSDRTGLVLVDVKRGVPAILHTGLPPGAPGGYASWPQAGVLHFTWRTEGAEKDDLWQLDETGLTRRVTEIDSARSYLGLTLAVSGDVLSSIGVIAEAHWTAPGKILRADPAHGMPIVAVDGDAGPRVLRLSAWDEPLDLLPELEMTAVEEILPRAGLWGHLLAVMTPAGRRLFYLDTYGDTVDLLDGLAERAGAFRTVLPDGTVVFATVTLHGSAGELHAWRNGERVALIARTGLVGQPGRAVASATTGDVLFNVIAMPDADNRVFLWDRKNDEIRALTSEYERPGTFLFTR